MATKKRATKTPKKQSVKPVNNNEKKDRVLKVFKNIVFWFVLFFASLIVVDYVVQYLNYHASIAVVNGERISRADFYDELEKSYGTSIASNMIDEALVYQEGDKEGVTVSDEDIQSQVEDLENQYGGADTLNEELKAIGMTRDQLNHQIETTLLVQKLLEDKIEITEEEAKEFFDEYKTSLFPDDEDITFEEAREEVEKNLKDQKINEEVSAWLSGLRSDATIQNNIESPRAYSFLGITLDFFGELFK